MIRIDYIINQMIEDINISKIKLQTNNIKKK